MSKITFAEDAWEEYLYWQSQDKKTLLPHRKQSIWHHKKPYSSKKNE